jgi:hypothetical protein
MVNLERARMTLLLPWLADEHEARGATCLLAPDGETTCGQPATHRVTITPVYRDVAGPVTFACAEHVDLFRTHPAVTAIREVHRHDS